MKTDPKYRIYGYHAHVYFAGDSLEEARNLCESAARLFHLRMGRMHERPVGPHPDWSCQLSFTPALFAEFVPWLALNRKGLVVFVHPVTGNELLDHTDFAIWMGAIRQLDLSVLSSTDDRNESAREFKDGD